MLVVARESSRGVEIEGKLGRLLQRVQPPKSTLLKSTIAAGNLSRAICSTGGQRPLSPLRFAVSNRGSILVWKFGSLQDVGDCFQDEVCVFSHYRMIQCKALVS